jgi:hypothetical protein
MKYLFCPFDSNSCLSPDALLPPSVITAQQIMFTPATQFSVNDYCYWLIRPPSEFTADLTVKVRIERLYGAECYLNYGGSINTAGGERTC